jgi:glycosyltransferase involved in cell wall biosynthesis
MDSIKPLVSVIMNCHNGDQFLNQAINSIYCQTYTNWEIIFFDNASTDNSKKITYEYDKKIKYHYVDKKVPLGEARNEALLKASGSYVAFLDCDDKFSPNKLWLQVKSMQKHNADMCYGSVIFINERSEKTGKRKVRNQKGNIFRKLLLKYDINMQTVLIKKSILSNFDLHFDSSLAFSPDYDLFMEIALIGKTISLKKYLSSYRLHDQSLTLKSQHLVCSEGLYTLNRLKSKYGGLIKKNKFAFRYGKSTFKIQESITFLHKNDSSLARKVLTEDFIVNPKALILLLLLYLRVSPRNILRLIGRNQ